jgi:hypothetical protein
LTEGIIRLAEEEGVEPSGERNARQAGFEVPGKVEQYRCDLTKSRIFVTAQPLTTPTGEKEALREILREYPGYSRIVYVPLR